MENSKQKPRLKKKYEGTLWKGEPIRNSDLSEAVAVDLLKNHPRGALLFDVAPEQTTDSMTAKELSKHIKTLETVEEVEAVLKNEERTTVIAAGKARIEEISSPE